MGAGGVVALLVVAYVLVTGVKAVLAGGNIPADKIQVKIQSYINDNLVTDGSAKVSNVQKYGSNMYKMVIEVQGQKVDSYATADGKLLFPQAIDMSSSTPKATGSAAAGQTPSATAPKSDKPKVELFIMSYCPYGTQMQKGILPAVQALGGKIDFSMKFVAYTMHGEKENQENLRQYCIETEQGAKYFTYLTCFLKGSDAPGCLTSAKVDAGKVTACMDATSKKFNVTGTNFDVYKAENDAYGVQGSPTLVINGQQVDSGRDSAGLLSTICSAFNTSPKECEAKLSSASPAPGFGEGTASASSAAAGCATQ